MLRQRMRGPPSPASLWWCTAGSAAPLENPPRSPSFRAESISSRNNDDDDAGEARGAARRGCAITTARDRACVPRRIVGRVCSRLGCTYIRVRAKDGHAHTHGAARTPDGAATRGRMCVYVRVKSGPPIDSEQPRVGPDRPVSPVHVFPAPATPQQASFPFSSACVYMYIYTPSHRMNALMLQRQAVLSQCISILFFQEMRLSIFYQTVYLVARLSVCS